MYCLLRSGVKGRGGWELIGCGVTFVCAFHLDWVNVGARGWRLGLVFCVVENIDGAFVSVCVSGLIRG